MPQDTESGRKAMRFGHEMAKKVIKYLGAKPVPGPSNNAIWNVKKINIKSAKLGNSQIGATKNNLTWADSIIAAIQVNREYFDLYEVSTEWFKNEMRPSRQPYTMMVECAEIIRCGKKIDTIPV